MIEQLKEKLPPPTLKKRKVVARQDVPEIMNEVVKAHKDYCPDYDKIAAHFWKGSVRKTAKNLFDFCKSHFRYVAETDASQTVRSPAAILETGKTWGVDCKHYAGFIGGVLDALRRQGHEIIWRYRFVSYTPNDSTPEHVFIVITDNGENVYIDPVLEKFNQRFPNYYYFQEKFPMLSRINGIEMVDPFGYNPTKFISSDTGGGGSAVKTTQSEQYMTATGAAENKSQVLLGGGIEWLKKNWMLVGISGIALYFLLKKK